MSFVKAYDCSSFAPVAVSLRGLIISSSCTLHNTEHTHLQALLAPEIKFKERSQPLAVAYRE